MKSILKDFEIDNFSLSKINGGQEEISTGNMYASDGGITYYGSEWVVDLGGGCCEAYVLDAWGRRHYAPRVCGN